MAINIPNSSHFHTVIRTPAPEMLHIVIPIPIPVLFPKTHSYSFSFPFSPNHLGYESKQYFTKEKQEIT